MAEFGGIPCFTRENQRRGDVCLYCIQRPLRHNLRVVMYVDLLTRALGNDEAEARSDDLLLADVVSCRARLRAAGTQAVPTAAESLARELEYDGALIRLCEALAVPATPAGFVIPRVERARLETELADRGVSLIASAA